MLTITKGELSVIRSALEEGESETRRDALEIVNGILEKNVTVNITDDDMYQDPMNPNYTEEELAILEQDALDHE